MALMAPISTAIVLVFMAVTFAAMLLMRVLSHIAAITVFSYMALFVAIFAYAFLVAMLSTFAVSVSLLVILGIFSNDKKILAGPSCRNHKVVKITDLLKFYASAKN